MNTGGNVLSSVDRGNGSSTFPTIDPARIPPPPNSNVCEPAAERAIELPPGYRLQRKLGMGGSALVVAAIQETLGREVAVKMLNPLAAAKLDAVDRFKAEATAIGRLNHPGIVKVFEAGEFKGHPYLVMELISGGTLQDEILQAPLPVVLAAECLKRVAEAVGAAHTAGIVHRDLKPSNILLEQDGHSHSGTTSLAGEPNKLLPKVADFGLAKDLSDSSHTTTGVLMGTPSYMSPEQASGNVRTLGPPTDVYGLGATLYACLTGSPPFRGTTVVETLDLVRNAELVPPRTIRRALPRDLDTICLKCLRKSPLERYRSANELAADLDRFLSGKPIKARPVGPLAQALKWCRRQPALASLLSIAALMPLVAIVAVSIHNAKLNAALANQKREREHADANYREARVAIARMLGRTSEQSAVTIPELRELERKQAEDALVFFRSVINEQAETDPEIRYQLAQAIFQLGKRTVEVGESAKAVQLYREALAVFDELSAANPSDVRLRENRALALGQIGFASLGSNPAKAEEDLLTAIELYAALHKELPTVAEYAHRLGQFTNNLGTLRRRANRFQEAGVYFQKAIDAHEDGFKAEKPTAIRRVMLADGWIGMGLIAWHLKNYQDAEQAFSKANEQLNAGLVDSPGHLDACLNQGTLHINWGLVAEDNGRPAIALARFERAVELLEDLYKREPKLVRLRPAIYNALGAYASQLLKQGKYEAAALGFTRQNQFANLDLQKPSWSAAARSWAKAGRTKECLEALEKAKVSNIAGWPKLWEILLEDDAFAAIHLLDEFKKLAPQPGPGKQ
jgi:serine/threonine protein kinase